MKLRSRSYRLLRYEDFVVEPGKLLQQAAEGAVGSAPPIPFLIGKEATVHTQHVLAGNPDKLDAGKIRIGDGNNQAAGPRRWLINLTTFPLQLRYQYLPSGRP